MRQFTRAVIALALVVAGAGGASAQEEGADEAEIEMEIEAEPAPAEEGDRDYDGVVPGESPRPPGAPWRSGRLVPVYWVGFQPQMGRVFVQLGRELDYQQRLADGTLVVFLPRARLANGNAARPLVTRFFDTPVAQVDARRVPRRRGRPAGIELRVTFKEPGAAAEASATLQRERDGYHYLYLSF